MQKSFMDIHVIQSVPPSCLNRDDTGSPKTAEYGGVTRSRISSQCWKRAMRRYFIENKLFNRDELGIRTKMLVEVISNEILAIAPDFGEDTAKAVANAGLIELGLLPKPSRTKKGGKKIHPSTEEDDIGTMDETNESAKAIDQKTLFYISVKQAKDIATVIVENEKQSKGLNEKKKANSDRLKDLRNALTKTCPVDIALFGRMLAGDREISKDASSQVAHAISTHAVENEFDFFTALDDYRVEHGLSGAARHLDTAEFNSATLYRYATVALQDLHKNLEPCTPDIFSRAVVAFAKAFIFSRPDGKQNSFAANTSPVTVYIAIRNDAPLSFVDAFEKPIRSQDGHVTPSIQAFEKRVLDVYSSFYDAPQIAYVLGAPFSQGLGTHCNKDEMFSGLSKLAIDCASGVNA